MLADSFSAELAASASCKILEGSRGGSWWGLYDHQGANCWRPGGRGPMPVCRPVLPGVRPGWGAASGQEDPTPEAGDLPSPGA